MLTFFWSAHPSLLFCRGPGIERSLFDKTHTTTSCCPCSLPWRDPQTYCPLFFSPQEYLSFCLSFVLLFILFSFVNMTPDSLIYESVSAHQVLSVLAARKNDKKAQDFVTKKLNRSRSRAFKLKFNISNNVDYVASMVLFCFGFIHLHIVIGFACLQQAPVFSFVQLFITNTVICWSASISNYRDVVPLTKIFNVKMVLSTSLS